MSPLEILVIVVSATSTLGQNTVTPLQRTTEQLANGNISFQYHNDNAKTAAHTLTTILTDMDESLDEAVEDLETSNNASLALKKYNDAEDSANGTNCFISDDRFKDTPKDIETVIKTCKTFVPQDDREALKKAINESLSKVQTYDNSIKLTDEVCFSLRVPPSQGCVDSKNKALAGIKDTVGTSEMAKFSDLTRKTFFNAKNYIYNCVDASTKPLQDQLGSWTKRIQDCQASLKTGSK